MSDEPLIQILKQALEGETTSPIGRINLAFGVIAVVMIVLLWMDSALEQVGDFLLRLFGREGRPKSDSDKLLAILSVLIFFALSLLIVALATPTSPGLG
jgi:hypothetical protein